MLTEEHKQFYHENGYAVVRGLFSQQEVNCYRDHYMTLRKRGAYPGDLVGVDTSSSDPLKRYPRTTSTCAPSREPAWPPGWPSTVVTRPTEVCKSCRAVFRVS